MMRMIESQSDSNFPSERMVLAMNGGLKMYQLGSGFLIDGLSRLDSHALFLL